MNGKGEVLNKEQVKFRQALAKGENSRHPVERHLLDYQLRLMPGGRDACLAYLQRAARNGDPDAIRFWDTFLDLLPVDQDRVALDDICEACGVAPDRILAILVSTAHRFGADLADLIAGATYPQIVHQTVKSATRIGGEFAAIAQKDRELLLQHHKFIPVPGRAAVIVNANAQAAAAAAGQPSVPSFQDSLSGAIEARRQVQREITEGELVDSEEE